MSNLKDSLNKLQAEIAGKFKIVLSNQRRRSEDRQIRTDLKTTVQKWKTV